MFSYSIIGRVNDCWLCSDNNNNIHNQTNIKFPHYYNCIILWYNTIINIFLTLI